jgi:branched-chain amino acid transport system ATP-binding protein
MTDQATVAAECDLRVKQLEVTYDRVAIAVQGVSLDVPNGGVVAVLGSNGAGKTTTLRAIGGFLRSDKAEVTSGSVLFNGREIVGKLPHEIARMGVVLVPERDKVFVDLSVWENLRIATAGLKDHSSFSRILQEVYEYFPVLKTRTDQRAGYLSGGERQMVAVARALLTQPSLLMIDEMSLGLSPAMVKELFATIHRLNKEKGTTVLLVEQNAPAAFEISDYVYILENGRVVIDGTPEKLRGHEDVQEFYLGLSSSPEDVKSYARVKQYRRARRWFG